VFPELNNVELKAPEDDAYDLAIAIAIANATTSATTTYQRAAALLARWH